MERQKKKGSSVYLLLSRELKILDYRHWTRFHMAICPLGLLFRPEIRKEKEERGKREGQNTEMLSLSLYVTNVEINKSLWAVDRLWQGGAAHSSSTIYETVAAVCLSEHVLPGWLVGCQAKVLSEIFKCLRAFHTGPVTPTEGALRAHMRGGAGLRHRFCVSITDSTTKTHPGTNKTTSLLFLELFKFMHVLQWIGLLPHNSWFKPWLLPSCVEFACYHCPCVSLCGQW